MWGNAFALHGEKQMYQVNTTHLPAGIEGLAGRRGDLPRRGQEGKLELTESRLTQCVGRHFRRVRKRLSARVLFPRIEGVSIRPILPFHRSTQL